VSAFVLTGRATRVPYRRDNRGIERISTVITIALMSWASFALQLEHIPRMCLMRPQVQGRRISIAGQRPFTVSTSDGEAARRWVRTPHLTATCPTGRLPARPVATENRPQPPAELVAVAATPSEVHPSRAVPEVETPVGGM
jgi:hypothetical protein